MNTYHFFKVGKKLYRRISLAFLKLKPLQSRTRSMLHFQNPKIFCIGMNKTGTTSLSAALKSLGYTMGDQRAAELLIEDWGIRDFRRLIGYCHSADAFQDVPFSYEYTFQALDMAYPGSKFILSVRDSPEQWFQSVIRFHTQRIGMGRMPTSEDLKNDPYVYTGWSWRTKELVYGEETPLYDEKRYTARYRNHNASVVEYFRHRRGDLLVINVAEKDAMYRLCKFLGRKWNGKPMPKLNVSS